MNGYDIGQILCQLFRETVYEICKKLKFEEGEDGAAPEDIRGYTWWDQYGIKGIKGKSFSICLLRDRDHPSVPGQPGKTDYLKSITIYDGYGFYAEPFAKVVDGLVKNGYSTKQEYDLIEGMKELR